MQVKKLIIGSFAALGLGAAALPATADVGFFVEVAPPAPRHEVVPAPRAGWAWVPGYWDWRGHRHHWVSGHWVRERPAYYYAPSRWVERSEGYYYEAPRWNRRDSDGDGVPNRYDRSPYNARWH
jgi:hypothetical protein